MAAFYKYTKKYAAQFLKNTVSKDRLQFLIFFVTSRCNCRCDTCFYWKNLNKNNDLSLEEIKKISASLGPFHTLLLSGGEPFLRNDLTEICRLFIEQNRVSILAVPTNGTYPERIAKFAEDLLKRYPDTLLFLLVSLDGFQKTHDSIKGVEGAFAKAIETLNSLKGLKAKYSNLELIIGTVITDRNAKELEAFTDFVYNNLDVNYHDFEILRGDHRDKSLSVPELPELQRIHRLVLKNRERYLRRARANLLERISVLSLQSLTQRTKERVLSGRQNLMVCTAGRNIGVIDPDGGVRLCELTESVGSLRDCGYNFWEAWRSQKARELKAKIRSDNCSCTHICFIKMSASAYFRTLFYLLCNYLAYRIKG